MNARIALPIACLISIAALPASADLLAWYTFDEGSGNVTVDHSGNGRDLSFNGTWSGSGAFGGSANVQGALARTGGSFSSTVDSFNTVVGNQLTVAFWARPNSENIGSSAFWISDSNTSGGNRIFQSHLAWTTGDIFWDVAWDQSTGNRIQQTGGTVADTLHHYVMTYDGDTGEMAVFKDNTLLVESTTVPGGAINWANIRNIEFGASSFVNGAWVGDMDDFAIWNEVIDASTRDTIFTQGVAASLIPEPSTLAFLVAGSFGLILRRRR